MDRREIGRVKEDKAVQYLEEQGYQIIARNYWTKFSELDVVANHGGYLCFIEVKYRADSHYEAPEGLITQKKIRRICKAVQFFLKEKGILPDRPMRFDVLFILGEDITLIKNAFEYVQ